MIPASRLSRRHILSGALAMAGVGCGRSDPAPPQPQPAQPAAAGVCPSQDGSMIPNWAYSAPEYLIGVDIFSEPRHLNPFQWEAGETHPVLARPNAVGLSADAGKMLKQAYMLLNNSNANLPNGTISLGSQAYLHLKYCSPPANVHQPGRYFLAWHRAFMFFHERLIQWTLHSLGPYAKDDARSFRLPYWLPSSEFGIYKSDSLAHPRSLKGTLPILPKSVLTNSNFDQAVTAMESWHTSVHGTFCGDFSDALTAGLDPMFYAFHSFVDLLWESSAIKRQVEPALGWGVFFNPYQRKRSGTDRDDGWVKVDLRTFVDPTRWGYKYDPLLDPQHLTEPTGLIFRDIPLGHGDVQSFAITARPKMAASQDKGGPAPLLITTVTPFGHAHNSYPYLRVDMDQTQAKKLLDGTWDFFVTINGQLGPVAPLNPAQVTSAF